MEDFYSIISSRPRNGSVERVFKMTIRPDIARDLFEKDLGEEDIGEINESARSILMRRYDNISPTHDAFEFLRRPNGSYLFLPRQIALSNKTDSPRLELDLEEMGLKSYDYHEFMNIVNNNSRINYGSRVFVEDEGTFRDLIGLWSDRMNNLRG